MMLSLLSAAFVGLAGLGMVLAQGCNGNEALCDRLYSNVTQVGAHDSAFVGYLPTENQFTDASDILTAGVRFLQAQTHNLSGTIEMCHTSCLELDAGSLESYLTPIKAWMDANTEDVVTLLLTNGDGIDVSLYGDVFEQVGLTQYVFTPAGNVAMADWPTLQSLIDAGTRLIVFMDYNANTAEVPYILDEFSYFFETPYDTTDSTFPECTLDRPPGASPNGLMGIVNHFLDVDILGIDIPDMLAAATTNSVASILNQSDICYGVYGRMPNFILLDFISEGNPLAAQDDLNNL